MDDKQAARYVAVPVTLARNPDIPAQSKGLYACLASFEGEHGVFPSQQSLADCMGASLDSVQRWLADLERLGAVRKVDRKQGNLVIGKAYELVATKAMYLSKAASAQIPIGDRIDAASDTARVRRPDTARVRRELPDPYLPRSELQPPIVPQGTPDLFGQQAGSAKKPDPAMALVELFSSCCPSLPQAKGESGSAAHKAAASAWKRDPDIGAWQARFRRIEASDFLAGRKTEWRAGILWALKPANIEKLESGQYDNRGASKSARGAAPVRTQAETDSYDDRYDYTEFDRMIGLKT